MAIQYNGVPLAGSSFTRCELHPQQNGCNMTICWNMGLVHWAKPKYNQNWSVSIIMADLPYCMIHFFIIWIYFVIITFHSPDLREIYRTTICRGFWSLDKYSSSLFSFSNWNDDILSWRFPKSRSNLFHWVSLAIIIICSSCSLITKEIAPTGALCSIVCYYQYWSANEDSGMGWSV